MELWLIVGAGRVVLAAFCEMEFVEISGFEG